MSHVIYTPIIEGEKSIFLYQHNILSPPLLDKVKKFLENQKYINGYCISGKEIPRQQLWFHTDGKYFCDHWKNRYPRWESKNHYPSLFESINNEIRDQVMEILEQHDIDYPKINSCLINKYRDGNDYIKPHSDSFESFGEYPIISGLSLGEERELIFKKKKGLVVPNNKDKFKYKLNDNSLFIMAGASQKYYTHEIEKSDSSDLRYSLTFREYLS